MDVVTRFLNRLAYLIARRREAADLAAELEAHRAHLQAHLESEGVPPDEAAARSRRAMGNLALAREDAREIWLGGMLQRTWRDAVYGARALRREPTFAATALLALTIGIATTTTAFSVVDAELWKPLPFPDARQLVAARASRAGRYEELTMADLQSWQARSHLARYVAAGPSTRRVLRLDSAESVVTRAVTPDFLAVLGVRPAIGRGFAPDDGRGAAILTDGGWTRLFARDRSALGRAIALDGEPLTIIGITAGTRFEFTSEPDFFVVLDSSRDSATLDRPSRILDIYARLHAGVGLGEAQAELRSLESIGGTAADAREGRVLKLADLQQDATGYNWRELYFFLGAAGVLLLLSGLSVAGLLLARALRRQREFAIRGALGGGVGALVRQLVVEGALLAVPASAVGLLAATWLLRVLTVHVPPGHLERGGYIDVDVRAAAFVVVICGITTIVLALTPMRFARRIDLSLSLGQGSRSAGPSRRDRGTRSLLLVAQVTVTVVLMSTAGLFAVSFFRLAHAPLGFDPVDRVALRLALSGSAYSTDASIIAFADRLLGASRGATGVRGAAVGSSSPLDSRGGAAVQIVVPGRPSLPRNEQPTAVLRTVSPAFFRTLDIRLSQGREFAAADTVGAPRVAIVNELLARRFFPGESAVGRRLDVIPRLRTGWTNHPGVVVIVGVVADVRNFGINEVEFNNLYLPFAQAPSPGLELVVDAAVPPADVIAPLRAALARVDPALPVANVETLRDRVENAFRGDRFNLIVVAFFAFAATLLAAVGVSGAMAYSVEERTREFGVRMALGAPPWAVVRTALSAALRIAIAGGVAGALTAFVIARLLGNALYLVPGEHGGLLYGVKATDPLVLASAALALVAVTIVAGLVPARRAVRIDPLIALRSE